MPPAVAKLKSRLAAADRRHAAGVALFAAVQLAAFVVLLWSEAEPAARAAFILAWGVLNFFWLVLLRRPLTSAALSLTLVVVLIMLSQFKHSVLMMTATFVDVMVIDIATLLFFIRVNPGLLTKLALAIAVAIPVWVLLWRIEPFQVRRSRALLGLLLCLALLGALAVAVPTDREDEFYPHQYVSKFARSSALAAIDLATGSVLEADGATADRLPPATGMACEPSRKLPHIVMVFDESGFDATMLPGVSSRGSDVAAPQAREAGSTLARPSSVEPPYRASRCLTLQ